MAIPLKLNTTTGNLARFLTADALDIDTIEPRSGGHLVIGATLGVGDEVRLGAVGETVRVMGDLEVDGSSTVTVNETVTGTFNADGDVNLGNNSGDTVNLGGGTSDTVNLLADLEPGAGTLGLGTGVTEYFDEAWLIAVNNNGPDNDAYNLAASGTNAGAYSIGIDPSLLANTTATDLMTALDDLDAAITGGGGNNLQQAYEAANTISVTAAEGLLDFSNNTNSDTTTVLQVRKEPSAGTAGITLQVTTNTNVTGTAVEIDNGGSGNALDVQDGGASVLAVDGAGAVDITPTSGQSVTITAAGAGVLDFNAAGAITLDSTGAGISIDAAGASNFSTSAGDLTFDSAAGELVFDDQGNSGTTLSQTGDRTFAQTAATEVLSGATSLLGAINRLAERIDADGGGPIESLTIENTVTITAGDVVAQSTTSGRITQWNGNSDTNSRVVGIALTGGIGTAGDVRARVAYPGNKITDSGASFTAANPIFGPDGTGRPVETAPSGVGDAFVRLGYAHSATEYVLEIGPVVIL